MIINSKFSDEALLKAIYRAAYEYSNLIGNSYLIIGKNKNSNYFNFQCFFEKKHFMHLLGIDSATMNATEFYEKCSCCAEILHIQDAKYMKIGSKDKISRFVDFTYGYGNDATLGFKEQKDTSFPITLIPRNIDEFVSQKYKIVFVLEKMWFCMGITVVYFCMRKRILCKGAVIFLRKRLMFLVKNIIIWAWRCKHVKTIYTKKL